MSRLDEAGITAALGRAPGWTRAGDEIKRTYTLENFVERDPYVPSSFRFRHALIRDAAYEGLSFRRRRELHGRVADLLRETAGDDEDSAEMLSLHFSLADRRAEPFGPPCRPGAVADRCR